MTLLLGLLLAMAGGPQAVGQILHRVGQYAYIQDQAHRVAHRRIEYRLEGPEWRQASWALTDHGLSKRALKRLVEKAHTESRFNPRLVSHIGCCCGFWQTAYRYFDTTCERLMNDPVHAADKAVESYQRFVTKCGDQWECCWFRGWCKCFPDRCEVELARMEARRARLAD